MTAVVNPILPGCYPDPSICRVGADYYLVTSTFEYVPGLPLFRSRDLVTWEQIGHVVDRAGQLDYAGIGSSGGLYAPTLRHHDGVFWLVCTLVDRADPTRGGNFVMTATDPAGPWSDPSWLDAAGIDPSLCITSDGRFWAHGTRLVADPRWPQETEVWLRELDPVTRSLVGPEHVLWNGALHGAVWAEGPHLYEIDGAFYLVAAEGGTEANHAVCVARAEAVTGPYVGYAGNPVLTHRHLGRTADVVGVGHADLVEAVDGSWWAVVLGSRPDDGHASRGRETFLVPVAWEDGWPVLAPGQGRVPGVVEVPDLVGTGPGGPDAPGPAAARPARAGAAPTGPVATPVATPEAGSGVVLPGDLRWTALRAPLDAVATPRGQGWDLALRPTTLAEPGTPAFLGVRQQHLDLDLRVTLRVALAAGEEAGIVVRQSEDDHLRLALSRPSHGGSPQVVAVHRRGGVDTALGALSWAEAEAEAEAETAPGLVDEARALAAPVTVRLGLQVRGQDYTLCVEESGRLIPLAVGDGRTLDSVSAGGFLGLWLGVYATSNGRATATTATVVAVEYLPVSP